MRNIDKLFKVEKICDLFTIKAEGKFPVWDIVRFDAYQQITGYYNDVENKGGGFKFTFSVFVNAINSFLNLPKGFKENMFFINSRNRRSDGLYFDITSKQCLDSFSWDTVTVIDTASPRRKLIKYPKHSMLEFFFRLLRFPKYKIDQSTESLLKEMTSEINKELGEELIDYAVLCRSYGLFRQEYEAYNKIFKNGRVQRVFFVQNGIHKGLLLAARESGVSTYELQHGIVGKDHECYSYSNKIQYKEDNIINPDVFFTLGAYWNNSFWHPFMRKIALGNNFFAKLKLDKTKKGLTVITSIIHESTLRPFAFEIASQNKDLNIYYKLHPNQFSESSTIQEAFAACPNVKVLCDQYSLDQLFAESNALLTIASTVVYEALQAGLNAIIFKKMNYEFHEDLFSSEDVFLIDGIEDYKRLDTDMKFNKSLESKTEKLFFEPFNREVLLQHIN